LPAPARHRLAAPTAAAPGGRSGPMRGARRWRTRGLFTAIARQIQRRRPPDRASPAPRATMSAVAQRANVSHGYGRPRQWRRPVAAAVPIHIPPVPGMQGICSAVKARVGRCDEPPAGHIHVQHIGFGRHDFRHPLAIGNFRRPLAGQIAAATAASRSGCAVPAAAQISHFGQRPHGLSRRQHRTRPCSHRAARRARPRPRPHRGHVHGQRLPS
jgi:hypothetical protein